MWNIIGKALLWLLASDQYQKLIGDVPVIPRAKLFGNPDRTAAQLSSDGSQIAFMREWKGVRNIWVIPTADVLNGVGMANERPVTFDTGRGVQSFFWTYLPSTLLYNQDQGGDEQWSLYSLDVSVAGAKPKVEKLSVFHPDQIAVAVYEEDASYPDIYKLNLTSGERSVVLKNNDFLTTFFDHNFELRLTVNQSDDAADQYFTPVLNASSGEITGWRLYRTVKFEDASTTGFLGFDLTNTQAYWFDSEHREKAALVKTDFATGKITKVVYEPKTHGEISGILVHPTTKKILALVEYYDFPKYVMLDKSIQADMDVIGKLNTKGHQAVVSSDVADTKWIIASISDVHPAKLYLYDRKIKNLTFLFATRPELLNYTFARMRPVEITSRDGLVQLCYLTLPVAVDRSGSGTPSKPSSMVLLVHGGPWARDRWGFDTDAQWLANRGHAVLQCNFRGSTGFGKSHLKASFGEWSGKMHDDLIDAVKWAVGNGIALKDKVAISGGSYGGYATLVGVTFTPEVFACGVDVVGPSNLVTMIRSIPPYWKPLYFSLTRKMGADPNTPEGKAKLESQSPLFRVNSIRRPLLIAQGANDPRVKQNESDQIVEAMRRANIPVTYLLFPNEGHGFARPENQKAFQALSEKFLKTCLGGRYEPIMDSVLKASSVKISET